MCPGLHKKSKTRWLVNLFMYKSICLSKVRLKVFFFNYSCILSFLHINFIISSVLFELKECFIPIEHINVWKRYKRILKSSQSTYLTLSDTQSQFFFIIIFNCISSGISISVNITVCPLFFFLVENFILRKKKKSFRTENKKKK